MKWEKCRMLVYNNFLDLYYFFLFVWFNHANGSSNSFKVCPWFSMLKWQNLSEWGCAVWGVYAAAGIERVNEPVRVNIFACFWFSVQIWPHICVRAHGLMCFVDSTAQKHVREEEGSIFSSLSLSLVHSPHTQTDKSAANLHDAIMSTCTKKVSGILLIPCHEGSVLGTTECV